MSEIEQYAEAGTCLKSGRNCHMPQEMDASSVQEWTFGSEASPNERVYSRYQFGNASSNLPSKDGSTVNYELNCRVWSKPYAKALFETGSEILLTTSAATEIESSSAFGN